MKESMHGMRHHGNVMDMLKMTDAALGSALPEHWRNQMEPAIRLPIPASGIIRTSSSGALRHGPLSMGVDNDN